MTDNINQISDLLDEIAMLYYKTDNIFSTIVMHSAHNTFAFVLYLVAYGMII